MFDSDKTAQLEKLVHKWDAAEKVKRETEVEIGTLIQSDVNKLIEAKDAEGLEEITNLIPNCWIARRIYESINRIMGELEKKND